MQSKLLGSLYAKDLIVKEFVRNHNYSERYRNYILRVDHLMQLSFGGNCFRENGSLTILAGQSSFSDESNTSKIRNALPIPPRLRNSNIR